MKTNQLLPIIIVLIMLTLYFICDKEKKALDYSFNKVPLPQRIEGRYLQEYAMTKDPMSNDVPRERLVKGKAQAMKQLSKKSMPQVSWDERGPSNISGRTRSILVDQRDASGNTIFAGGVGGGLWKSTNGGNSWTIINEFYSNMAVTAIVQDPANPNVIYFGTGESWGVASNVRGLGIWKSTNGGISFTHLQSTNGSKDFDFVNGMAIQNYNGTSILYAATSSSDSSRGGLLFSKNGGSSWLIYKGNNIGKNNFASDVAVTAGNLVLAGFGGGPGGEEESDGVYYSVNGGDNWFLFDDSEAYEGRIEIATSPSAPDVWYYLCENFTQFGAPTIYSTFTTGGFIYPTPVTAPFWADQDCNIPALDWTRGQDWYDLAIAVSPSDPYKVLVGAVDIFLLQRTIIGDNWTQLSNWAGNCQLPMVHADIHSFAFANNNKAYVSTDGGVYRSTNANSSFPTFSFKGNGLNITQFYAADLHPESGVNEYLAGAQDNGSHQFKSSGMNQTIEVTSGDGMFCHIDQTDGDIQIGSYTNQTMFVTHDGWNSIATGFSPDPNLGRFVNPTDFDDVRNKIYACDGPGKYLRWNDPNTGGTSFNRVTVTGFPSHLNDNLIWSVRVSPNVSGRAFFGFDGARVVRVDNAHTGTSKTGKVIFNLNKPEGHVVSCIEIQKGNENHILITLSNYGITSVYESTNALAANPTWRSIEGNLPDMPIRWAMFNPNNGDQAYLATELGVWRTDNLNRNNTNWVPTNTGLANVRIDMIKYRESDQQVVIATHGRGLYTTDDLSPACANQLNLTNQNLSGIYQAGSSLSSTNVTVQGNTVLSAPSVIINPTFTVNLGQVFEVKNDGCN